MTKALEIIGLKKVYAGGVEALKGIDLVVEQGDFYALLGPNGAGKTTLLRAALGLLPHEGQSSLSQLTPSERAKKAAFMPQGRDIIWPITVERLVALGRIAHGGPDTSGPAAIEQAIAALELEALRHRPATQLSGGEQARALIARALAQQLLDDALGALADIPYPTHTLEAFAHYIVKRDF